MHCNVSRLTAGRSVPQSNISGTHIKGCSGTVCPVVMHIFVDLLTLHNV